MQHIISTPMAIHLQSTEFKLLTLLWSPRKGENTDQLVTKRQVRQKQEQVQHPPQPEHRQDNLRQ